MTNTTNTMIKNDWVPLDRWSLFLRTWALIAIQYAQSQGWSVLWLHDEIIFTRRTDAPAV